MSPKKKSDEPRINRQIEADKIRLIDATGQMVGVVSVAEGLRKAQDAGLDLVEISPQASPPVCKILDYGKYKYEAQKKAHEARKKQKIITVKEIKLRSTIDKHDLEIKTNRAVKFLEAGDKVKISLRFRGREMAHQELGKEVIDHIRASLEEQFKIEQTPRMEGNQMTFIVAPR